MNDVDLFKQNGEYVVPPCQNPLEIVLGRIKDAGDYASPAFPVVFVLLLIGVVALLRRKTWIEFARCRKWAFRSVLSLMALTVFVVMAGTSLWLFFQIKGRISPETPSMIGVASKFELYRAQYRREIEARLASDKKDLLACIEAIGRADAQEKMGGCESLSCLAPPPSLSRPELFEKIEQVRKMRLDEIDERNVCKKVDRSALMEMPQ